jgi:hypothetical protein
MRQLKPIDIIILMHIYIFPEPYPEYDSPSFIEAVKFFLEEQLVVGRTTLKGHPQLYSITDRGRKLIEMMCGTPLPEKIWIDPRIPKVDQADKQSW